MTLKEALELYRYADVSSITKEENVRRYRKLVHLYHPDNGKSNKYTIDNIREARENLNKYCEFLKKHSHDKFKPVFIDIDTLIKIYKNKTASYNGVIVNRNELKLGNIFLDVEYSLTVDGITNNKSEYVYYNNTDKYKLIINIDILTEIDHKVTIIINNKAKEIVLGKNNVEFTLNFECNIDFYVYLNRRIVKEE